CDAVVTFDRPASRSQYPARPIITYGISHLQARAGGRQDGPTAKPLGGALGSQDEIQTAPAPERGTNTPWKTFLAANWDGLAAADSFTVEVLTFGGIVRYSVFFVMKLKTRAVEI